MVGSLPYIFVSYCSVFYILGCTIDCFYIPHSARSFTGLVACMSFVRADSSHIGASGVPWDLGCRLCLEPPDEVTRVAHGDPRAWFDAGSICDRMPIYHIG
jgi:hypothetical protein